MSAHQSVILMALLTQTLRTIYIRSFKSPTDMMLQNASRLLTSCDNIRTPFYFDSIGIVTSGFFFVVYYDGQMSRDIIR